MKKRITIYLDQDVVDTFKTRAAEQGAGYQTMINETLKKEIKRRETEPESTPLKKRSLAEVLLEMPEVEGHDDLFERIQDDERTHRDVFD